MGQGNTKDKQGKEDEQNREIKYIVGCLKHHRDIVYGILHCVNSHHANVESVLLSLYDNRNTGTVVHEQEKSQYADDTENGTDKMQHDRSSTIDEKTRRLLCSIQDSLQCQSSALKTSFEELNLCIHGVLGQFRPEYEQKKETSVDLDFSKKWLPYENSPAPPINDIREALKCEKEKCSSLQNYLQKNTKEIDEKNCNIKKLSEEVGDLSQENEKNLTEKKELERKIVDLEENIKQLTSREVLMTENILELKNKNECLDKQLKDQESRIQVQLFYQSRGEIMSKVADELKALLADSTGMGRNKIQFIDCLNEKDVNHDIPLFLMCINASRIGTDVESTLQKLKGYVSTNVSVLIFHHKDAHALPSQGSDRVLTGPDFQMLGGIFDLAFLSEKGIYACDMNATAASGIVKFLREKH